MTKPLIIHGLPTSLARDGWWIDSAPPTNPSHQGKSRDVFLPPILGLLLLVVSADFLFWHQNLGISVAVFALIIFLVATVGTCRSLSLLRPALALIIAILPVANYVQALSIGFLAIGLAFALVWARSPDASFDKLLALSGGMLRGLPRGWLRAMNPARIRQRVSFGPSSAIAPRALLRDWAFPVAGSFVFAALLMQANPVLARLLDIDLDLWAGLSRALFWTAAAVFVTPFLAPELPEPIRASMTITLPVRSFGLNEASVLRALVLFNLMVGLQSLTDLSILMGGAVLPAGMTFAEYAHRGAYPLLATALLAGAFALAARPFLGEHRAILPLLLIWITQNMVLCGAAMLRLEHYVAAFGLTYLRLYALIWMGLVAVGLGLMLWQVIKRRSNLWLLARSFGIGFATLYICSFVNFAQIIATQNLSRPNVDFFYICELGPMAGGAVAEWANDGSAQPRSLPDTWPCDFTPRVEVSGWRDWGYRSWKVGRYIAQAEAGKQMP